MKPHKQGTIGSLRIRVFAFLSCFALGTGWADQVVLKNGDRVTGEILKKDGTKLTIKTTHFGLVTTSWDEVESVKADTPVTVVLADGKTAQGTLSTTNGKVEVATKGTTLSATPGEVVTIRNADEQGAYERLQKPGWAQLWAGNASLGFAGAAANAKTSTLTVGLTAARITNTDKTSIYFDAIKATALVDGLSSSTAQAVRGGLGYDHNITPRLFLNVFNDYEYDRFQNLDLRFVIGGGLGFHVIKTERSLLDLLAGADFNHSKFSTPLTRNSAELYWGNDYDFKLNDTTSFLQSFRMFNDVTHTGTYRVNFDIGATTKLGKWLNWNVSVSDRYLNNPAPGRKTNDVLYTTGVGITFAR